MCNGPARLNRSEEVAMCRPIRAASTAPSAPLGLKGAREILQATPASPPPIPVISQSADACGSQTQTDDTGFTGPSSGDDCWGDDEGSCSGAGAVAADGKVDYSPPVEHSLRIYVGTGNMHAKDPPERLAPFLPNGKGEYELYAFGTQEAERSISRSVLVSSKAKWEARLHEALGSGYVRICRHTLTAIHLAVFIKRELLPLVSHVQSAHVATGIGNKLGNKGGIGISFQLGRTSVLLINCHLSAHQHKVHERDKDFHRIDEQLPLRPPPGNSGADDASGGACACFDAVVWFGDLNYRIRGNRNAIEALCSHASGIVRARARRAGEWAGEEAYWASMREVLLANDQLRHQQMLGSAFKGFVEAPITFKPTYKFDAESDSYDTGEKRRAPAYTDRILYKGRGAETIRALQYDACSQMRTSDHRHVFALLEVRYELSTRAGSSHRRRLERRRSRSRGAANDSCLVS